MSISIGRFQSGHNVSYAARVIGIGVICKGILMGVLVSALAVAPFLQSLILVLVSACATGVFGLLVVLIQTHSEKTMHSRLDAIEGKGTSIEDKATTIDTKVNEIKTAVTPEETK